MNTTERAYSSSAPLHVGPNLADRGGVAVEAIMIAVGLIGLRQCLQGVPVRCSDSRGRRCR